MNTYEPVYTHAVISRAALRALVAIGACLALALGMAGPVAAAPGDPGHITGTVTGEDSGPLVGALVQAYVNVDGAWERTAKTRTKANGSYSLELEPGSYMLRFWPYRNQGYRSEYYENAATLDDATATSVTSDNTVVRNAELAHTAGISGHIEHPDSWYYGTVSIINAATGKVRRNVWVDENGDYAAWNLRPGTYRVAFDRLSGYSSYEAQFYEDKPESTGFGSADEITVGVDEAVTGIDATLVPGGRIVGELVDGNGDPLSNCLVQAYVPGGITQPVTRSGWVNWDGSFTVGGLTTADYRLRVVPNGRRSDCDGGTQFYAGTSGNLTRNPANAQTISVTSGATKTLTNPLQYTTGGRITGHVTLPAGSDDFFGDRVVLAKDTATGKVVAKTRVQSDGAYTLRGLLGGTYRVTFNRLSGMAFAAAQFYNGKAEHLGSGAANLVDVSFGAVTNGIDATLAAGGSITGRLVSAAGAPLEDCYVQAYTPGRVLVTRTAWSDADGEFSIGGLTTGDYKLRVVPQRYGDCDGGTQFYVGGDGKLVQSGAGAVPIEVTLGSPTDLTPDLVYTRGARISGTVTLPDGASRYQDTSVRVVDATTGEVVAVRRRIVNNRGEFSISGLLAGTYRVTFNRVSGYAFAAAEFYDSKPESSGVGAATLITLDEEEVVDTVNASLVEGGHVKGRIVDAEGNGLSCEIQAFTTDRHLITRTDWSTSQGFFDIGGLTTGAYLVRVLPDGEDCNAGRQFVANNGGPLEATIAGAEAVNVTLGANTNLTPNLVYARASLPPVVNDELPVISGTPQVGSQLTASPGSWTPATGLAYDYQWKAGASDVGTNAATYTPVAGDVGKTITVRVTASKAGYEAGSATSGPTSAVAPLPAVTNTGQPVITGTAQVGSVLSASTGSWDPSTGLTYAYQWRAGASDVGTNAATYTPVAGDVGKTITVRVTASKSGYTAGSSTSAPTAAVAAAGLPPVTNTGQPAISGTPQVGSVLSASTGSWDPSTGLTFAYQWRAGASDVGSNSASYTPVAGDVGKTITVRVTASKSGYAAGSATSAATSAVTAAPVVTPPVVTPPAVGTFTLTSKPSIKGDAEVGKKLKVKGGAVSPAATSVVYQWLSNGKAIKKATSSSYKLKKSDKGKKISLRITYVRAGYTSLVVTTKKTGKVIL